MQNMNDDIRPSPESLLAAIHREEKERSKGHLKIFLGMAAGVGKTYSMLEEAQLLNREGVNIVVGIAETHGREETAALLKGLKIIPPKIIRYRDKDFRELDIDEVIRMRPELVIVDELAHTNIPGSRHAKRWEDVVEILENGINVYTTLNVQHIESLNDVVERIAGISVRETVPDSIVETAASIQVVDLNPDELLQRLKEGKVYLGDQSKVAALNFFQKDRLTALREIVLRFAAEKVDHDLNTMVSDVERGDLRAREKLLVAVSHSPHSQKLIRTTRRIAFNLDTPWIAVHIDDGTILSEEDNNQLAKNLALARELGAEVITTHDPDIVDGIHRIARQRGVTQIIIGRPPKRSLFDFFREPAMLSKLAIVCRDIDILVVRQEKSITTYRKKLIARSGQPQFFPYVLVTCCVLLLSGLCWLALPYIGYKVVGGLFLLAILGLSLGFTKGPTFLASILCAIIWKFIFIPPQQRFEISSYEDDAILVIFILTALVTGILVDRGRQYKEMLAKREESAQSLYDIMRQIVSAPTQEKMLQLVKERLGKIVNGDIEIFIRQPDNGLVLEGQLTMLPDDKEKSVAFWSFENGKEAGWSTTTLPSAKNMYLPLKGFHDPVGILVYKPKMNRLLTTEQKSFLYTVCQQLANYLERILSEEKVRKAENLQQVEKIYHTVLKSISHEFSHPLSDMQEAIYEAFQALKYDQSLSPKKKLVPQFHKIENTSTGLLRMLDNVAVMAKLSGSLIPINIVPNKIEDAVKDCIEKMQPLLIGRPISISIQDKMPLVSFDYELIGILLHNLIRNAIENSPPESPIDVQARLIDSYIEISVSDEGKGVPDHMLEAIFEEFYRMPGSTSPGMGLGLPIAKRIAEIHNGYLKAENRPGGGAKFSFLLPV